MHKNHFEQKSDKTKLTLKNRFFIIDVAFRAFFKFEEDFIRTKWVLFYLT